MFHVLFLLFLIHMYVYIYIYIYATPPLEILRFLARTEVFWPDRG